MDLDKARRDVRRYERAFAAATDGMGSETAIILAATRCADNVQPLASLAEQLLGADMRVRQLHQQVDEGGVARCKTCIGAYDPRSGELVRAMWPCLTAQAIDAGSVEVPDWESAAIEEQGRRATDA